MKSFCKLKYILLLAISMISITVYCYGGEGTTAANFLKFSYSSRQAALAGAYSAIGNDSYSIFSNPAGITSARDKELGLGFTTYLEDSKLGILSYKTKLRDADIGFGFAGFNIDSIERRTNDAVGIVPSEGSFDSTDMEFIFSYAKKDFAPNIIENLSAGASLKFINSKIDDSSAQSIALDLGLLYHYLNHINISFALLNLGTKMKYESESDNIPLSIKAGFSYSLKNANLVAEVEEFVHDEKFYPSIGAEYFLGDSFVLRTGYKFGYDTSNLGSMVGFACGFGIIAKDVSFNYAYVPFGELGNINRFDIQFGF
ncbi:MAG: PorV/PorQ family protein [Elusimicrobiales bacterium]|nr:PorV/PorQ family protein [Elusimicrobiales bacterium]